jgi:hypothetical protein
MRVKYEELILDLEPGVRRLLEFCGLEFESACLEFDQPAYKERSEHWRHFERWLTPLRQALAPDGNA